MEDSISVRIPAKELQEIQIISEEEKRKKSDILREIMYKGIMEKKLEIALKKFQNNEATAWKSAKIAGIPLTSFLEILTLKKIEFHYDSEDFKDDLKNIEKYGL
jgi:predicted HTH domain antitoxin